MKQKRYWTAVVLLLTTALFPATGRAQTSKSKARPRATSAASEDNWLDNCRKKCPANDSACLACCKKRSDDSGAFCAQWCGGTAPPKSGDDLAVKMCKARYKDQPVANQIFMLCVSSMLILLPSIAEDCNERCWSVDWKKFDPQTGCRVDQIIFGKGR